MRDGYNPCICVIADCFLDCILSKTGAAEALDISDACLEKIRDAADKGDCPFWSDDGGSGGNGGPFGTGLNESVENDCDPTEISEKLKGLADKAYKWYEDPDRAWKGLNNSLWCCAKNFLACMSAAALGNCPLDGATGGYIARHWGKEHPDGKCILQMPGL